MHVVFIEPCFPANQKDFVRGLHSAGARITGIGERSKDSLDGDLRSWMLHYEQIGNVCDEEALTRAVRWIQSKLPVDRLEATVEAHILPAAHVREACGIPGTSARTAYLCRDKPAMKEVLQGGGIPTARSLGSGSADEIRDFAEETGYPLILKPRAAAGASGTTRVDSREALEDALISAGVLHGNSIAVEEFVEGHEAFYDTLTIGGRVVHEFITHYYPNVLEAMRQRWISPQFITTNRIDSASHYGEVKELGQKVISLLDIQTSATHMEWFFGPKGLKFSEIGCRPPGVRAWDLYNAANEMDLYTEWAMAVCHGEASRQASRRYSAGLIALRPDRDGHISGYEGIDAVAREFGRCFIDAHFPTPGTPTQSVDAGYMANAWIRLRHEDYDELRRMLDSIGRTVKVHAQ